MISNALDQRVASWPQQPCYKIITELVPHFSTKGNKQRKYILLRSGGIFTRVGTDWQTSFSKNVVKTISALFAPSCVTNLKDVVRLANKLFQLGEHRLFGTSTCS